MKLVHLLDFVYIISKPYIDEPLLIDRLCKN
jgi:hypothetical protein